MKRFISKNFMLLSGILIFISLFTRFYLLVNRIDIIEVGMNISIDYTNLLIIILGISVFIIVIYYLPLLFLVKYRFEIKIRFHVQEYRETYLIKDYLTYFSKQNTYKKNNVILCWKHFLFQLKYLNKLNWKEKKMKWKKKNLLSLW